MVDTRISRNGTGMTIVDDPEVTSSLLVKSPTIYDVAKSAGVSHQTVSRLLRGYEGIRPPTRQKVLEAMERLQYRPNSAARALKAGRSHRIAALTHEVTQVGPSAIIRGATAAAREAGYLLDVVSLDVESIDAVSDALLALKAQDLDGIIALASTDEMGAALDAVISHTDVVRADEPDDDAAPSTSDLSTHAIPTLVEHLYGLGHRHVMHIAGPRNWAAARNRRGAFERAAARLGMPEITVVYGDWSAASGYRAVRDGIPDHVTAIMAANDQMALGAIYGLNQAGIGVPEAISVTGIDDIPEAEFFIPPLTTIRVDFELQGRNAISLALKRLGVEVEPPQMSLSSEVIVRRSSSAALSAP